MKIPQALLKEIAAIRRMERGTLSPMKSGRYYNHQTWQDGRNRVRYVPPGEVEALRKAIAGYRRFCNLTRQYADLVIRRSRSERTIQNSARKTNKPMK
jgi:hypothetical protein